MVVGCIACSTASQWGVPSNEIAKEGGVLNCISWNIIKPVTPYDDLEKEIDRDILCMGLE